MLRIIACTFIVSVPPLRKILDTIGQPESVVEQLLYIEELTQ